jgi:Family of unknown function (DUF5681)
MTKAKDLKYEIGYGRPPLHSRFRKGQSGNPAGRRRYTDSQRGKDLLRQEANRLVTVREGEKVMRMPAVQAAIRRLFHAAAQGDRSALRLVLNALQQSIAAAEPQSTPVIQVRWREPGERTSQLTDKQLEEIALQGAKDHS